jgi:cytoskeleton protein RodZ
MKDEQGTYGSTNEAHDGEAKIGAVLEKARKERGLTLDEAEHATKIRKRYLAGLEREDYGVLPDAVYARGFLKTYANYLGLDGEGLAQELRDLRRPRRERGVAYGASPKKSDFERPLVNLGELGRNEKRRVSGSTILGLLLAVLMLAAIVGYLYYVGLGAQSAEQSPEAPQPPSQSEEQAAGAPNGGPNGGAPARGDDAAAPPETLTVVVSVEGDPSWLSVVADGRLVYEQIAEPGFTQTFEAERAVSIKTGNAGAVAVEVNGQDLGRLGESGEVLTRDFTLKSAS